MKLNRLIKLFSLIILFSAHLLVAQSECFNGWRYVQRINVRNFTFGLLNDWQVRVNLNTQDLIANGKMNPDGSDIRFASSDCCTNLPYWIQSGLNTPTTVIWVRVPQLLSNTNTPIQFYYGNPAASNIVSDLDQVMFSIGSDSMGTDTAVSGFTSASQELTFPINCTTVRWRIFSGDTTRIKFKVSNDTNMVTGSSPFFTIPSTPGFYIFDYAGAATAGGHPGWYTSTGGKFLSNCAPITPCPGSCGYIVRQPGDLGTFGALDQDLCGAVPNFKIWYRRRAFADPSATLLGEFDKQRNFLTAAPGGTTMCFADTLPLQVNGIGASSYQWYQDGMMVAGATDTIYNAFTPGNYHCVATFSNACERVTSDTTSLSYHSPATNLGNDTLVCTDNGFTLDAGPGYTAYLWDNSTTMQTRNISQSGQYWVQVTDSFGCTDADTINITLRANPDPVIVPSSPQSICPGTSITLSTFNTNWFAYRWLPNMETSGNIVASQAGDYRVVVWDSAMCSDTSAVFSLNHYSTPNFELGGPFSACQGDSVALMIPGTWAGIQWQNGPAAACFMVAASGNYVATVQDSNGCFISDTAAVTIHPNPVVDLGPSDSLCPNEVRTLDVGPGWASVLWRTGDTTNALNLQAPAMQFVTVVDSNGCTGTSPAVYFILRDIVEVLTISQNGNILSTNHATGNQWYKDGLPIAGANGDTYEVTAPGIYFLQWAFVSVCDSGTLISDIIVFDPEITEEMIPQGFSPNGDNINDYFEIQNLGNYPQNKLVIMNRWGSEVFSKSPYDNSFNGLSSQGKELPDGTYFYILDLGDGSDVFKGYLIINR